MPSQYRRDVARLKGEIVGRVLAGERQRAICASPGMPGAQTVRHWALADVAFGAELAAARKRGDWMRRFAFDEAVAAAFLARARAGETINSLVGAAGMPSRATYAYWTRTQGSFAEAVYALRQRRDARLGAQGRARRRGFDWAAADRVTLALYKAAPDLTLEAVLAGDPGLPCRPTLTRWRREEPEFDRVLRMVFAGRRARRGAVVPELIVEEIAHHITVGGSFASFSRLRGGPSRTTLRRWFRADRAFADQVSEACDWREHWYLDHIEGIAMRTPPGPIREMTRAVAPLTRHLARLRHRPGAAHKRARLRESSAG